MKCWWRCLKVYERTGAEWAANYFELAYRVIVEKFSQRKRGLPGYTLFTDRQFTHQPHVARQDNYHPVAAVDAEHIGFGRMDRTLEAREHSEGCGRSIRTGAVTRLFEKNGWILNDKRQSQSSELKKWIE